MTDDFTPLTEPDHYLGWLGDDPAAAVREQIEGVLRQQVATAKLDWVRLVGEPEFLTGGRRMPDDLGKLILTRAALAVPFTLQVSSEGRTDLLRGVFSWVAVGLDGGQRRDRTYFDLDAEMDRAKEQLVERIYELGAPQEPPGSN